MQRSKACLVALSLFALAAVPSLAAAGSFGVEAFGSFNTYSMKDVNDGLASRTGSTFDDVANGLSGGLGARMWANQNWLLSANWEPLRASSENTSTTPSQKYNVNASSFQVSGTYFMPSATNSRYGFGAGLGYYSISGEDEASTPATKIEGSGAGFHFQGVGEWSMNKQFSVTGTAGYRLANIEMKDSNGNPVPVSSTNPANATADYSGFIGRVGLVMYFPSSSK